MTPPNILTYGTICKNSANRSCPPPQAVYLTPVRMFFIYAVHQVSGRWQHQPTASCVFCLQSGFQNWEQQSVVSLCQEKKVSALTEAVGFFHIWSFDIFPPHNSDFNSFFKKRILRKKF